MYFDLSDPDVKAVVIEDRPTVIAFAVPMEAFERPTSVLFAAVAEYLSTHALEDVEVDAFTLDYVTNDHDQRIVQGTLYTRLPLPWARDIEGEPETP
jgi:hypothetical protein